MNEFTKAQYNRLFPDDKCKAEAFDRLAEHFYHQNFSTMAKAEIDLLMFSEYLERIFVQANYDEKESSDYALSKVLGITPSRVSSLKERKELKYPSQFDWKMAFKQVVNRAELVNGKVQIYINDHRLYSELRHVINDMGSYSEMTLTRQLLVVSLPVFVDLMVECEGDEQAQEQMREKLCEILRENAVDSEQYLAQKVTFKDTLKNTIPETAANVVIEAVKLIPGWGTLAGVAAEGVKEVFLKSRK